MILLFTLAACTGNDHATLRVTPEPAGPDNETLAQVDRVLQDFFSVIDKPTDH